MVEAMNVVVDVLDVGKGLLFGETIERRHTTHSAEEVSENRTIKLSRFEHSKFHLKN